MSLAVVVDGVICRWDVVVLSLETDISQKTLMVAESARTVG